MKEQLSKKYTCSVITMLLVYCIVGKFGGLVVYITTAKLKSAKISYSYIYVYMVILYRTAKSKSANILANSNFGLNRQI